MAIQTANLGTAPSGAGGDTFRSAATKFNENFTNNAHAASRLVGTQAGNVMEVGVFGLGRGIIGGIEMSRIAIFGPADVLVNIVSENKGTDKSHYFVKNGAMPPEAPQNYGSIFGFICSDNNYLYSWQMFSGYGLETMFWRRATGAGTWSPWSRLWNDRITTVDSNGFIKAASPIVKLFADRIELNDEAQQQNIEFEKLGVGDYLIKGSTGFAQDGWYVETPKDANGNLLVAVVYEQLENGDISVKTYDYMLNKKGRIVADIEAPLDITGNRWIDLRLQELPQPEIEIPESITPPDFQPTGLAEAVATVMESYNDPEQ